MERLQKLAEAQLFIAKGVARAGAGSPLQRAAHFANEQFGGYGRSVLWPPVSFPLNWAAGASCVALVPAADAWPLDHHDAARRSLINLVPFPHCNSAEEAMKPLGDWAEWL